MAKKGKKSAPKKEVVVDKELVEAKKIEVIDPEAVAATEAPTQELLEEKPTVVIVKNAGSPPPKTEEFKAKLAAKPTGEEILKAYMISNKGIISLRQRTKGGNAVNKMTNEAYIPLSVVKQIIAAK
jgi:hypothetical protein